ncbi:hypothetical protein PVAP13_8KG139101 [Panicum virgatum]|uniref:Uncharacterized protein n=1 Tax=Panicum virgatum TaxID=38727 RepID=A0A8T0PK35_PANVG|nr:hypothetical protein PVAP13_8KG139101 [Panicum virgatum]
MKGCFSHLKHLLFILLQLYNVSSICHKKHMGRDSQTCALPLFSFTSRPSPTLE